MPLQRSNLIAFAQVLLMPICIAATLLCVLIFVLMTGIALLAGPMLLFDSVSREEGAAMVVLVIIWLIACSGIVAGIDAINRLTIRDTSIVGAHAIAVSVAIFGGGYFW